MHTVNMAYLCSVLNCTNSQKINKRVKFFCFPKGNIFLCKKWIMAAGRPGWVPLNVDRICEEHFVLKDYENFEYKILKNDTIPTKNLPSPAAVFISSIERLEFKINIKNKLMNRINTTRPNDSSPDPPTSAQTRPLTRIVYNRLRMKLKKRIIMYYLRKHYKKTLFLMAYVVKQLRKRNLKAYPLLYVY